MTILYPGKSDGQAQSTSQAKRGPRPVTMADVAARAAVSVSSVSHVLNQTRFVSTELTARVEAAAAELGYLPALRNRTSTTLLGVVMTASPNRFFSSLFSAIEHSAHLAGYSIVLADSRDDVRSEALRLRATVANNVAGVILVPAGEDSKIALDAILSRRIPVVLVDRGVGSRFDQVGSENITATAKLVEHLSVNHGHRRIGFIKGRDGLSNTVERLSGYRRGLEEAGLKVEETLIQSGESSTDGAAVATRALLALPNPPTALISGNDDMTIGMLRALRELELKIPNDIAVAAYDDIDWPDAVEPSLTVAAQQVATIGRAAVNLLLARIERPDEPAQRIQVDSALVVRGSCGCAPCRKLELAATAPSRA